MLSDVSNRRNNVWSHMKRTMNHGWYYSDGWDRAEQVAIREECREVLGVRYVWRSYQHLLRETM